MPDQTLRNHPQPAASFADARARVQAIQAQEGPPVHAERGTLLLEHGQRQPGAIVFFHGYTNSPPQFYTLAQACHALGYNALVMRLPHHGLADRMTSEVKDVKAAELAALADQGVDIACGLGERVVVCGLSAGGVTAAWAAQTRAEIDLAVVISPAFGFAIIPSPLTRAVMLAAQVLPNRYQWWDAQLQDREGLAHAYPRYATHSLAQIVRLGFAVRAQAARHAPAARAIWMVSNANDQTVSQAAIDQVTAAWQKRHPDVRSYQFARELQLDHDLIDPLQPLQRTDIVYPRLLELIPALT